MFVNTQYLSRQASLNCARFCFLSFAYYMLCYATLRYA